MRAQATRSAILAGKDQLWTAASMREQATHSALLAAKMAAVEKEGRRRQLDKAFAEANPQPEVVDAAPPSPSPKRRERRLSTGPTLLRVFPFARRSSQVSPAPSSGGETPNTHSQSAAVSLSGSRRNSRGSNSSFQRMRRVSVGGTISVVISESFQKTRRLVRRRSSAPAMTMTADGTLVAASAAVTERGSAEPTLAEAAAAASALVPDYTPPPTPPQLRPTPTPAGRGPAMLSTPVAAKIGAMSRLSEGAEDTSSPRGTSALEYASESPAATPWGAGVAAEAVRADSEAVRADSDAAGAAAAAGAAPAAIERDTAVERSGNVLSAPQLATPRPSSPWRWRPHAGLRARRSTAPQHGQSTHVACQCGLSVWPSVCY